METVVIRVEGLSLTAELNRSATAIKILDLLPLEGTVNLWGDEIYFDIDLQMELESGACAAVEVGALGYWPAGPAFCIFFGPTPASTDHKPRACSPVKIFGRINGDAARFKSVSAGSTIRITRAERA